MKKIFFIAFLLIAFCSSATHIRGGRIQFKKTASGTVEFTFIGYRDVEGVLFGQGIFDFGDGDMYGDENDETFNWEIVASEGDYEIWMFKLVHTYENIGMTKVSYSENFRSSDIINVSGSVSTNFYVEAMLSLDPLVGTVNSSPILLVPPNFTGFLDGKFTSALTHEDLDEDSLAYHLVTPLSDEGLMVNGYRLPKNFAGEDSSFDLNVFTGNLTWDKIETPGDYLVAIKVEEWRKVNGQPILIGYSTLDFVISIIEIQLPSVELIVPPFTCLDEGENYQDSIIVLNQSNLELELQFITDLEALRINDLSVSDWNSQWQNNPFTDNQIQLNLTIPSDELSNEENLGNVLFTAKGDASTPQALATLNYSINRLVAVGCDETKIVLNISDEAGFWDIRREGVEITFNDADSHRLALYTLDGVMLEQVVSTKSNKINLIYPFVENTVYVILLHSSTGVTIKKIRFTP